VIDTVALSVVQTGDTPGDSSHREKVVPLGDRGVGDITLICGAFAVSLATFRRNLLFPSSR
jgi:hypothetical protein